MRILEENVWRFRGLEWCKQSTTTRYPGGILEMLSVVSYYRKVPDAEILEST